MTLRSFVVPISTKFYCWYSVSTHARYLQPLFLKLWQSAVGAALETTLATFTAFLADEATAESRETMHVVDVSYGP